MSALLPVCILVLPLLVAIVERIRTPTPVYATLSRPQPDSAISTPLPRSLATAEPADTVVGFLKAQHQEIRALFAATLGATGEARQAPFLALRRLIAAHEAIEEELVHPVAERALGASGHAVIMARMGEERGAATTMTTIEQLPLDSLGFEMDLRKLAGEVVEHARLEERDEFPALVGLNSIPLERVRDVSQALYGEPGAALLRGVLPNRDIGPFVAMLNKAREALTGNKGAFELQANDVQNAAE